MKTRKITGILIGLILGMLLPVENLKAMSPPPIPEANKDSLVTSLIEENITENNEKEVTLNGIYLDLAPLLYQFYAKNDYKPVWTTSENSRITEEVLRILSNSMQFGIDPDYFALDYLLYLNEDMDKQQKTYKKSIRATQFELLMTHSVMQFYIIMEKGELYYDKTDCYEAQDAYLNDLPGYVLNSIHKKELVDHLMRSHPKPNTYSDDYHLYDQSQILGLQE